MIKLTQISAKRPERLAKHYEFKDGELEKSPGGFLTEGSCDVIEIPDMEHFADFIRELRPREALTYGTPKSPKAMRVVTKQVFDTLSAEEQAITIARSNECFDWHDGPGIFMIDYDPEDAATALGKDKLLEIFSTVCPEFDGIPKVWWPSSSSHICHKDGTDLTGLRGQRIYVPVRDARKIPHMSMVLEKRFWAMGFGYVRTSRSGQRLKRTLIDHSVYQPCRLDFAAGASTGPGLNQERGEPEVIV